MGGGDYEGEYDPIICCRRCCTMIHIDESEVLVNGDRQEIVCYTCAHPSLTTKIRSLFGRMR